MADAVVQITKNGTVESSGVVGASFLLDIANTSNSYGREDATFLFEWNIITHCTGSTSYYALKWLSHAKTVSGAISVIGSPYIVGATTSVYPSIVTTTISGQMRCIVYSYGPYDWRVFANVYIIEG